MAEKKDENNIDIDQNEEHNVDDVVFDDIDEDGKSLENVKKVRDKLRKCEDERKEYLDGWQRAKADFVNMRKRDEENKIAAVKAAKESVILSVLPVLDSFEMAFGNSDHSSNLDPNWVQGMQGIRTQLENILAEYGVIQMHPEGEEFDPNLHDSVESVDVKDASRDGKIIAVIQKGYQLDGKIIRAAKVTVGTFSK